MRHARPAVRLTVLAGPSGVGAVSVIELIRARSPFVWLPVRVTTRRRRDPEIDGVHYRFVDRLRFERLRADGRLLEWAEVAGSLYGTPRDAVETHLRVGRPVLLRTDPAGARQVRAAMPQARIVLLAPPSIAGRSITGATVTGARGDVESGVGEPEPEPEPEGRDGRQEYDAVVVNDLVERAAGELIDFVGCSFPAPAQPHVSG